MQNRDLKAKSLLTRQSRNNAVLLENFPVPDFAVSVLEKIARAGIRQPAILGGSLRDHYMRTAHGFNVVPKDYDVIAAFDKARLFQPGQISRILDDLAEQDFSMDMEISEDKENPEILAYEGNYVVTLRLKLQTEKIDLILMNAQNNGAQQLAATGDTSVSSIAMDREVKIYTDPDFVRDASEGIYRIVRTDDDLVYIKGERHQRLNQKYKGYFKTIIEPAYF